MSDVKDLIDALIAGGVVRSGPSNTMFKDYLFVNPTIQQLLMPRSYGFEDIAITQKKNIVQSRLDCNITSEVMRGLYLDVPMIASNMSSVTNWQFCAQLYKLGAMGVLHRAFPNIKEYLDETKELAKNSEHVAVSVGVPQLEIAQELVKAGANIIFVDIAHGYSDAVIDFCKVLRTEFPHIKIVVGNTVNTDMLFEVEKYVDALKVGLAQGFACETKNTAACTEKQFSAILKFKEVSKKVGLPIISDGGIREAGDFTKSIAAGANSIMAGMIFARCPESAAEIVNHNDKLQKMYYGMASRMAQDKWRGGVKKGTCPEGTIKYLDIGENVDKLLERYSGALRSGITYGGGKDIVTFQDNVEFVLFK